MRFIYQTDEHLAGRNPVKRLDDYARAILDKINYSFDLAVKNKCEAVISGGDIFNSYMISLSVVHSLVKIVESHNIPFYIVNGNHTQSNCNVAGTILEFLYDNIPLIKRLDVLEDETSIIKGLNYTFEIDNDLNKNGYFFDDSKKMKIFIPHANITPAKAIFTSVSAKEFKTNADLVLVSHYHSYHGIKTINDTKYCWIGSLSRGAIGEENIERTPKVLLADTATQELKELDISCAKDASEVFDIQEYRAKKTNEKSISEFFDSLKNIQTQAINFVDRLNEFIVTNNVDPEIKSVILNRMPKEENKL